ncbi:hypothetical protein [Streptomyces sp. NPDC005890]|uniref:hypothetical protein n=1 Tax=Streptomyces sp. NPDC005890 TaxID=3154568 RepID=UPI0034054CC4
MDRATDEELVAMFLECRNARDRLIVLLLGRVGLRRGYKARRAFGSNVADAGGSATRCRRCSVRHTRSRQALPDSRPGPTTRGDRAGSLPAVPAQDGGEVIGASLPLAHELQDLRTEVITDALDAEFLSLVSWNWESRVVRYPEAHPVLGMPDCEISGYTKGTPLGEPVCVGCIGRWRRSGLSFEDFAAVPRKGAYHRSDGQVLCRVPGCSGRPGWSRMGFAPLTRHAGTPHPS